MSDHGFEHFVGDGGQDTLVVIGSDVVVDFGELVLDGTEEDSECDIDCLEVFGTGGRGYERWSCSDFESLDALNEGDSDPHTLAVDSGLQTTERVHLQRSVTTIHNENELRKENTAEHDATTSGQQTVKDCLHDDLLF